MIIIHKIAPDPACRQALFAKEGIRVIFYKKV
jgi:hypothetical protein